MQAALVARTFAISADHKVRVGCGALDIAGTRRTSACRRSDCTVAETGRKRRSKRPDKARLACAHKPAIARHFQDWARSSRRPPTDRGWERGAPARSLYLGRGYSCGLWHGDRRNPGFALLVMPAVVWDDHRHCRHFLQTSVRTGGYSVEPDV